ncbi:MAG: hypothetical protein NVSMB14_01380 [Isosphaeraceae bacterium]
MTKDAEGANRTSMHRIFLGLAIAAGTFLSASVILGFVASGEPRGPHEVWHGIHLLFGLGTVLTALMTHSIVFTYFLGTTRWVKEVAEVYRMPEWVYSQARKNKSKAFPFEIWSMSLIGATAWVGAASDAKGLNPLWHLAVATLTIGFNLGAFVVEYGAIVAQARLILEVKDRADRQREEQLAARGLGLNGN